MCVETEEMWSNVCRNWKVICGLRMVTWGSQWDAISGGPVPLSLASEKLKQLVIREQNTGGNDVASIPYIHIWYSPPLTHTHPPPLRNFLRRSTVKRTFSFGEMLRSSNRMHHRWKMWDTHTHTHTHTFFEETLMCGWELTHSPWSSLCVHCVQHFKSFC